MDGGWYNFNGGLNGTGYPHDPWGMRNLSDYLHSKGLKLGMYVTGGFKVCVAFFSLVILTISYVFSAPRRTRAVCRAPRSTRVHLTLIGAVTVLCPVHPL